MVRLFVLSLFLSCFRSLTIPVFLSFVLRYFSLSFPRYFFFLSLSISFFRSLVLSLFPPPARGSNICFFFAAAAAAAAAAAVTVLLVVVVDVDVDPCSAREARNTESDYEIQEFALFDPYLLCLDPYCFV